MQNRRGFFIKLATCFGIMGVIGIGGIVFADELLGVISKVDVEGKKLTVIEKDTDKEIEVKTTDETEVSAKGGFQKVDLEKLDERVKKAIDQGKKGLTAKIIHEKNVASKIEIQAQEEGPVTSSRASDERPRARDDAKGPPVLSHLLAPSLDAASPGDSRVLSHRFPFEHAERRD